MFGPKPARDDHPALAFIETHGLFNLHRQMKAALDEIDELRTTAAAYESHVCEHDYYGGD